MIILFPLIWLALILSSCISSTSAPFTTPHSPSLTPAQMQTTTSAPSSTPTPIKIQLAWFYKPPLITSPQHLSRQYNLFILTRMDENTRDQLLSAGVQSYILQYLLLSEIQDPGSCTDQPNHNQVAEDIGDYCDLRANHPDWFLYDSSGQIIKNDDGYQLMDPANLEWRQYWLDQARRSQDQYGWHGVFLDNVEASLEKRLLYGALPQKYPDDTAYQAAVEENLRFLYSTYFQPSGIPLLANIISLEDPAIWFRYLQYLDGAMLENFAVDWNSGYLEPAEWETQLMIAEQTQALSKEIILVSQGSEFDQDRQLFAFSSYLLINNGRAYFRYSNDQFYDQNWLYSNYQVQLGQPLGPRYQINDSWIRDFENGTVTVNPYAYTAAIDLH